MYVHNENVILVMMIVVVLTYTALAQLVQKVSWEAFSFTSSITHRINDFSSIIHGINRHSGINIVVLEKLYSQ